MKAAKYDIYTGFSIDRVVGRSVGDMTVTTDRPLKPGREQLTNDGQTSTFYDPIYKLPPFVKKHKWVYETPNLACLLGPTPSCTREG